MDRPFREVRLCSNNIPYRGMQMHPIAQPQECCECTSQYALATYDEIKIEILPSIFNNSKNKSLEVQSLILKGKNKNCQHVQTS